MTMFDEPEESGGVRLNPQDIEGHLLLIWAVDYIAHSPTKFTTPDKKSDVIVVDCVDLEEYDHDANQYGLLARKCWWRQARLIGALRSRIGSGRPMLAYMTRGVAVKGQPPYELISATQDEESAARGALWLQTNPDFTPSLSAPPPAAVVERAPVSAPPAVPQRVPPQRVPPQKAPPQRGPGVTPAPAATSAILARLAQQAADSQARRAANPPQEADPPF